MANWLVTIGAVCFIAAIMAAVWVWAAMAGRFIKSYDLRIAIAALPVAALIVLAFYLEAAGL